MCKIKLQSILNLKFKYIYYNYVYIHIKYLYITNILNDNFILINNTNVLTFYYYYHLLNLNKYFHLV